jgi:hypothetical protein
MTTADDRAVVIEAELLADYIHMAGGVDTDPNAVRSDPDDGDLHVGTNENAFARLTGQHKHGFTPFLGRVFVRHLGGVINMTTISQRGQVSNPEKSH